MFSYKNCFIFSSLICFFTLVRTQQFWVVNVIEKVPSNLEERAPTQVPKFPQQLLSASLQQLVRNNVLQGQPVYSKSSRTINGETKYLNNFPVHEISDKQIQPLAYLSETDENTPMIIPQNDICQKCCDPKAVLCSSCCDLSPFLSAGALKTAAG